MVINGSSNYTQFPATSAWNSLSYGSINLNAGNNTIEIKKSWGWMHVDYIEVGGGAGGGSSDLVTPNPTAGAVELWNYIKNVPDGQIISGIWREKDGAGDVNVHSGKFPAMLGGDMWCWHPYGSCLLYTSPSPRDS